jgi:hypothetical protein
MPLQHQLYDNSAIPRDEGPKKLLKIIVKQLKRSREYHGNKYGANKFDTSLDYQGRADFGADDLPQSHTESGEEYDVAADEEHDQRDNVAGEIHHFGVTGCLDKIQSQQQHHRDRPERTGPGTEKPVVKANAETEHQIENRLRPAWTGIMLPQIRGEDCVYKYRQKQEGNYPMKYIGVDHLYYLRAGSRSDDREHDAPDRCAQADAAMFDVIVRGRNAAEGRLEFVGAKRLMWR